MTFRGFPPAAFEFYERLEADNNKAFWHANKVTYEDAVRGPMIALGEELGEYGPFRVFRPYNDLRFAKGRPPYKTNVAMASESEGGASHYVSLSATGMMVGTGYYAMATDQLDRFRAAVDDGTTGPRVEALAAELVGRGYGVGAIGELKTAPRGFAKDHPRVELLRRKGLTVWQEWPERAWMHSKKALTKVRDTLAGASELDAWLDRHVGPSTLPPPDFER